MWSYRLVDPVRIVVADDHAVVRQGLRLFLDLQPDLTVVGEASDGAEALEQVKALRPDLVLMDLSMPGTDGVQATRALRAELPETKVLVLAIFPRGADKAAKQREVNEGANAIIKGLADEKNVFYLDIGPKFLADDGTLSREVMPDLLHLNEQSYRTWAEAIEPSVKKLMGE